MSNRYPRSSQHQTARSNSPSGSRNEQRQQPRREPQRSGGSRPISSSRGQSARPSARPPQNGMTPRTNPNATGRRTQPTRQTTRLQHGELGARSTSNRQSKPSAQSYPSKRVTTTASRNQAVRNNTNTKRNTRRRRKRLKLKPWVKIALVLILVLLVVRFSPIGREQAASAPPVGDILHQAKTGLVSDADKSGFDETIGSDSAILISADNGDVLYSKDAETTRPPASLTKMMTVYVAIKHNDDLAKEVKMPEAAIKEIEGTGAVTSGLMPGEKITIKDLLYAAILPSGADAANALAIITSGNEKSFVELMNKEAKSLGLDSTHFTNATGLDNEKQYSTCRDMARLLKMAMGDASFEEVITTRSYTTSPNDVHENGISLTHTMDKYLTSFQRYFDISGYEIVGGKTGYTVEAGNCLASVAKKEDAPTYIAVTMHATGDDDQYYQSVKDAVNLYGKAYE